MHSSARSELKSELADSRIETKLPIKDAGVLHACLGVRDSDAGAMMPVMQRGPRCPGSAYDQVDVRDGRLCLIGGCIRIKSGEARCMHYTALATAALRMHRRHMHVVRLP